MTGCVPPASSALCTVAPMSVKRASGAIRGNSPVMSYAAPLDRLQVEEGHDLVAVVADENGVGGRLGGQDRLPLLAHGGAL
jgi:hypothetical protein